MNTDNTRIVNSEKIAADANNINNTNANTPNIAAHAMNSTDASSANSTDASSANGTEKPSGSSAAGRLALSVKQIRAQLPGLEVRENEPMSAHCSFRTGGPAAAFAAPDSATSFAKVLSILKDNCLAPFILGNGTNVVFPDEGTPGLFVLSTEKLQRLFLLPDGSVYAEAGVSLARLASFALEHSLTGLEFASGIPGTVGGGAVMNAGAYGGELKDVVQSVVLYYLQDQSLYELTNENCAFGYRTSYFQKTPGCVILSVVFSLHKGNPEEISGKMKELNARRRDKQPLELPSAGSAFRRPEGHYAAALIEECGLKGFSIGGAQVSEKHAGFIVNTGTATSKDLHDLMRHVRNTVYREKQVPLEPEIILLPPDYVLEDNGPKLRRNRFSGTDAVSGTETSAKSASEEVAFETGACTKAASETDSSVESIPNVMPSVNASAVTGKAENTGTGAARSSSAEEKA